jgi:hypothetical protein
MQLRLVSLVLIAPVLFAQPVEGQTADRIRRVLSAADLPVSADQARREGAPDGVLQQVLAAMRAADVPAHEAREVIDEERAAMREHGPVDNFGAFVQSKLDAGLRGRDLAGAIRAEHELRGAKRGERAAQPVDRGTERGKSSEARDSLRDRQQRPEARPGKQPEASEGRAGDQRKPADPPVKPNR